jgi:hypothetical protein
MIDVKNGSPVSASVVKQASTDPDTDVYLSSQASQKLSELTISVTRQAGQRYAYITAKVDGETEASNLGILGCK